MKAGPLLLAALAAAQPAHHRRHQHQHRRDLVVEVVTEVDYVTSASVVVYVDSNGSPIYTVHNDIPQPTHYSASPSSTSQPAPVSFSAAAIKPPSSSVAVPKLSSTPAPAPSSYSAPIVTPSAYSPPTTSQPPAIPQPSTTAPPPAAPPPSHSSSAPASQSPAPATGGATSGYGLTYTPYRTDNSCKNQEDVNADFQTIFSKGSYGTIRLYGTDCNQVAMVLAATAHFGPKLFLGIFHIDQVEAEAQIIVSAVNGDWSRIDTVSVGNELVNNKEASVDDVAKAVKKARACLTGYNGPVVTVDTFIAIINNPGLCQVGDYVAANCHPFYDGSVTTSGAGQFVREQVQRLSSVCGGKKTIITESGWPSQGDANKVAVPSPENQQTAISSLRQAFSSNLFLFSAFNEYWKPDNPLTFHAEQHWGILGNSASCQP